jgi:bifunctional DNase/RNase
MATCLRIGLIVGLLMSLPPVSISKQTFIEMEVIGVSLDAVGQTPVVILADKETKKVLPIWVGFPEASAIERELKNAPSVRPMTHDLLHSILGRIKVTVKEVRIVELKGQTFYASLFLNSNKELIEVDARPSDAIILALKSRAPVFVSTEILDKQGVGLTKEETSKERYGIRFQQLTPSLASHFNFKGQKGVLVSGVVSGSVSEASGIRVGDIIMRIGLKEVENVKDFEETLDGLKDAHSIPISIFRDGTYKEVTLSLKP